MCNKKNHGTRKREGMCERKKITDTRKREGMCDKKNHGTRNREGMCDKKITGPEKGKVCVKQITGPEKGKVCATKKNHGKFYSDGSFNNGFSFVPFATPFSRMA